MQKTLSHQDDSHSAGPLAVGLILLILIFSASPALAQENIAKGLLDRFVSQTDGWWDVLRGYALFLFTVTLTIEICLFGIRIALQQTNIAETFGQFVMLLLFAGFIAAVIMNYKDWATGIAINGLRPLIGQLTGNAVDAGQPVAIAAALVEKILPVMEDAGITDFGEVYLFVSCMLIIIVVFVLISALVILTTCEFYIVANIGVLIIGLGGSKLFKDYAVNVMRYVLSVALKLFVLQLIVNIGFAIISLTDLDASVGSTLDSIKFVDLFFLIGKAVILLALAKSLPDTCAGMLSGASISGGNPLASMAKTAGAAAVGAATAGAGYAAGAASALNNAHTVATEGGGSGGFRKAPISTMGGMAKAVWQARGGANDAVRQKSLDSNPGSMRNQLTSRANAVRAERELNKPDSSKQSPNSGGSGQAAPQQSGAGESGQAAPQHSNAGGSGQAAPQQSGAGESGQAAPQQSGAGGSGQAAPQQSGTGGSGQTAPQQSGAGGSGQTAPQQATVHTSEQAVPKNISPMQSTLTSMSKKSTGTVDMRSFNSEKGDKK